VLPAGRDEHIISGAGTGEAVGDARRRELGRCAADSVLGGNIPQHHAATTIQPHCQCQLSSFSLTIYTALARAHTPANPYPNH